MPINIALPLSPIWLLLPKPSWKPTHRPAYFLFPTFQQTSIRKSLITKVGVHQYDRSTPQMPGEFGQNPPNQTSGVCGLLILSLSVLFSHQMSIQHDIFILQTLSYLNRNQPLAEDETQPILFCIKIHHFVCLPEGTSKAKTRL